MMRAVSIARDNVEEYSAAHRRPAMSRAVAAACARPVSLSGMSVLPTTRRSRFAFVSPCRTR